MEDKLFYFLDPFGPSRAVRGAFTALKLVCNQWTLLCICMADRRYFKDRSDQIGRDNIVLDGYKVVQLKSCVQFDGVNCGVICLKVHGMHSLA